MVRKPCLFATDSWEVSELPLCNISTFWGSLVFKIAMVHVICHIFTVFFQNFLRGTSLREQLLRPVLDWMWFIRPAASALSHPKTTESESGSQECFNKPSRWISCYSLRKTDQELGESSAASIVVLIDSKSFPLTDS